MTVSLSYTADVVGGVEGGLARRGTFLDNLDLIVDADLEKAIGWRGATAHVDVLSNSGGTPNDDVGTLQGVDNVEVSRQRLRLFEASGAGAFINSLVRSPPPGVGGGVNTRAPARTYIRFAFNEWSRIRQCLVN